MTTQTVELDPATGLPELPTGYVWEIAKAAKPGLLILSIKEKVRTRRIVVKGWFKREWVDDEILLSTKYQEVCVPSNVSYWADRLCQRFTKDKLDNERVDKLVGIYPPQRFDK